MVVGLCPIIFQNRILKNFNPKMVRNEEKKLETGKNENEKNLLQSYTLLLTSQSVKINFS